MLSPMSTPYCRVSALCLQAYIPRSNTLLNKRGLNNLCPTPGWMGKGLLLLCSHCTSPNWLSSPTLPELFFSVLMTMFILDAKAAFLSKRELARTGEINELIVHRTGWAYVWVATEVEQSRGASSAMLSISTQLNSTQVNSIQVNSTLLDSTLLSSPLLSSPLLSSPLLSSPLLSSSLIYFTLPYYDVRHA